MKALLYFFSHRCLRLKSTKAFFLFVQSLLLCLVVVFCLTEVCLFCSGSSVVILVFLQKSISYTTLQFLGFYVLRLFPFTLDTRGVTANIVFVVTYKKLFGVPKYSDLAWNCALSLAMEAYITARRRTKRINCRAND